MAQIVGGFVVPHDPIMFVAPDAPSEAERKRVYDAYARTAERIAELGATTAVVIGCDHYILFGTHCLPQYIIGTGEIDGPLDQLPGLKRGPIEPNPELARHIAQTGFDNGFDFAVGRVMTVDHSVAIPHKLMIAPNPGVKTVPIMLAAGVDPYLPKRRAYELGKLVRKAIDSYPSEEKVVVIGSGGISHWVGDEHSGRINPDFDQLVLDAVIAGDAEKLIALEDSYILEHGGNGAMEIRTFICAMGVMGPMKGEVIAYEPVKEWITGLGFAELKAA